MFILDDPKNNIKNILHAFFLSLAISMAEPSTILPLVVHYFSDSTFLVGLFSALQRGGSVLMQLYASFHAQSYQKVLPYLKKVFFIRFFSWFFIGFAILVFGKKYPNLTLFSIGIGLFFFSFSAGFGGIYFKELQAKLFSHEYRKKTMANRRIAGSIASIISGAFAAAILSFSSPPTNYAMLFIISSFLMSIGFIAFASVNEPIKKNISAKEKNFFFFLQNAFAIFRKDKTLQTQTIAIFLSFSYLLAMPFMILQANSKFHLSGLMIGGFITFQMLGSILLSFFLWRPLKSSKRMLILAIILKILSFIVAMFANDFFFYALFFFLIGGAIDGVSIASLNLVIEIAPEDKRPIYTALQTNFSYIGLFFPLLGSFILQFGQNFTILYTLTILFLFLALLFALKLNKK